MIGSVSMCATVTEHPLALHSSTQRIRLYRHKVPSQTLRSLIRDLGSDTLCLRILSFVYTFRINMLRGLRYRTEQLLRLASETSCAEHHEKINCVRLPSQVLSFCTFPGSTRTRCSTLHSKRKGTIPNPDLICR